MGREASYKGAGKKLKYKIKQNDVMDKIRKIRKCWTLLPHPTIRYFRGVFRTYPNIYDGTFFGNR